VPLLEKEVFVLPYKTSTLTNGAPQCNEDLMEPLMSSLLFELESKSVRESNTAAPRNAVHDQAHAPSSQCLSLFFFSSASLHTSLPWTWLRSLACQDAASQCVVCLLSRRLVLSSFQSAPCCTLSCLVVPGGSLRVMAINLSLWTLF
jgi:hypothetical protein